MRSKLEQGRGSCTKGRSCDGQDYSSDVPAQANLKSLCRVSLLRGIERNQPPIDDRFSGSFETKQKSDEVCDDGREAESGEDDM